MEENWTWENSSFEEARSVGEKRGTRKIMVAAEVGSAQVTDQRNFRDRTIEWKGGQLIERGTHEVCSCVKCFRSKSS